MVKSFSGWLLLFLLVPGLVLADRVPCIRWDNTFDICYGTVNLKKTVNIQSTPQNILNSMKLVHEGFCSLSYRKNRRNAYDLRRVGGPITITSSRNYNRNTQTYRLLNSARTHKLNITLKIKMPFSNQDNPADPTDYYRDVIPSATYFSPGALYCSEPAARQSFRIGIDTSQFRTLKPDTYTGNFTIKSVDRRYPGSSSFQIRVKVNPFVRISGLGDIQVNQRASDNSGYQKIEDFCVFSVGGEPYTIQASGGAQGGGAFVLKRKAGQSVNYQVQLTTRGRRWWFIPVAEEQSIISYEAHTDLNCQGGSNASVQIDIPDKEINNKPAGVYTGVLYLLVSP